MAASKRDLQTLQKQLSKIVDSEWVNKEGTYVVVRPGTNDEVAQILKLANRTKRPVVPLGGSTGWWSVKKPSPGGILIRMTRMNEILMIDEDAMTVTAQAGITYRETGRGDRPERVSARDFPGEWKGGHVRGPYRDLGDQPSFERLL